MDEIAYPLHFLKHLIRLIDCPPSPPLPSQQHDSRNQVYIDVFYEMPLRFYTHVKIQKKNNIYMNT